MIDHRRIPYGLAGVPGFRRHECGLPPGPVRLLPPAGRATNTEGKATRAAVCRPSQGRFIVRVPEEPTGKRYSAHFGKPGDVPTCMDVDGDGTDDFVLWRPGERRWYRNTSESRTYVSTATEDSYAMGR